MARITPLDLRKQEFKQSALGLNRDQVHEFLEMVAEEMETLIREKSEAQEEIKDLQTKLDRYSEIEKSMNSALVMARESANQAVKAAEKEAGAILAQARTEKNALLFAAKDELNEIQNEIRDLKLKRDGFIMNFKTILKTHQEALEAEFSRDAVMLTEETATNEKGGKGAKTDDAERIIDFSQSDLTISDLDDEPDEAPESEESEPESDKKNKAKSAFEEALEFETEKKDDSSSREEDEDAGEK
ncbi:MAG: DivIVA domain-containing protein [Candidatus Marinimicrobia bacterium]|nr:DivIVA domain-containing protein [Candidatus Neomarinimicrobiota bacterium]MCF7839345.1 DivIVA domain-containing protein [Candidatus Neomarinimicrobiota bacterium]MCF7902171.1 DivIVA domain-containing protein [Candidatus Neomarinimicrobiota bacterium]